MLIQLVFNGLITGSLYALVASGYSLIYSTNRIMHFAHGTSVALSAYIVFLLFSLWHVPFAVSAILTLVVATAFGLALHRGLYLPLQKRGSSNIALLIASLGVLILFQNLFIVFFSSSIKSVGLIEVGKGLSIFGGIITPLQIVIIAIALVSMFALHFFMKKTKLGRNIRAVADHKELASIIGISYKRVADYSFMIGSGLAGVAGILIGLEQSFGPLVGTQFVVKGFTAAIIGGITSVPGAIIGGYFLSFAENFSLLVLPAGMKEAISFVLLFVFLLFKPKGLFGIDKGVRK